MNDHEAQRIASAMNQLRPDWPVRQLLTLLGDERMRDRPRRDVLVALGWVACEPATHTPYRVLEAGPWWRAAGIEGSATSLNQVERHQRCSVCSLHRDRCASRWAGDHDFAPDLRTEPTATADHVAALKASIAGSVHQQLPTDQTEEP